MTVCQVVAAATCSEHHPEQITPAEAGAVERIEGMGVELHPGLARPRGLQRGHEVETADVDQHQHGGDDDAGAHHEKLQVIGHEHREHAAERGVKEDEPEQDGHDPLEPRWRHAGGPDEELAAKPQEDAHVEQAAEHDEEAREPAHADAEAFFKQLGNGHHPGGRAADDDETGAADEVEGRGHDHADARPGEALLEAELGGIHDRHEPELCGGERGDAEVDVHLAAGDSELLHAADVAPHPEARDHAAGEVNNDDEPVERGERHRKQRGRMGGHAGGTPAGIKPILAERSAMNCRGAPRVRLDWRKGGASGRRQAAPLQRSGF
jgi:hypothetical protein